MQVLKEESTTSLTLASENIETTMSEENEVRRNIVQLTRDFKETLDDYYEFHKNTKETMKKCLEKTIDEINLTKNNLFDGMKELYQINSNEIRKELRINEGIKKITDALAEIETELSKIDQAMTEEAKINKLKEQQKRLQKEIHKEMRALNEKVKGFCKMSAFTFRQSTIGFKSNIIGQLNRNKYHKILNQINLNPIDVIYLDSYLKQHESIKDRSCSLTDRGSSQQATNQWVKPEQASGIVKLLALPNKKLLVLYSNRIAIYDSAFSELYSLAGSVVDVAASETSIYLLNRSFNCLSRTDLTLSNRQKVKSVRMPDEESTSASICYSNKVLYLLVGAYIYKYKDSEETMEFVESFALNYTPFDITGLYAMGDVICVTDIKSVVRFYNVPLRSGFKYPHYHGLVCTIEPYFCVYSFDNATVNLLDPNTLFCMYTVSAPKILSFSKYSVSKCMQYYNDRILISYLEANETGIGTHSKLIALTKKIEKNDSKSAKFHL